MAGYVRNDTSNNIATGNIINASDLDGEFDAIQAAFVNTTGHTHDGTAAEGAPITKVGPAQDIVVATGATTPKTNNVMDLGSSGLKFKDIYAAGTAYIATLDLTNALTVADGGTGATTLTGVVKGNGTSAFTAGNVNLASEVTGTLPVANGGSGVTTITGLVKGNGASAFSAAVAGTDFPGLSTSNTFTAAQTFRAANSVRAEAAATQDAIVLAGRAAGTSSFAVTLTPGGLSASRTVTFPDASTIVPVATQVITFSGPSAARTYTLPDSSQTLAALGVAQTFTAAQTFRAANAIRSEAASTQDAVVLAGRAGGTSSFAVTLTPTTLAANRTITLPDATTTMVGTDVTQTLSAKTITGLRETRVAMGANDVDISAGNYFTKTISVTTTFTVSNVPTSGTAASFILDLTNGGSATINWWSGVKWASGTAPTLTAAGRDVLGFFTHDGGTTWTGLLLGKDVK